MILELVKLATPASLEGGFFDAPEIELVGECDGTDFLIEMWLLGSIEVQNYSERPEMVPEQ